MRVAHALKHRQTVVENEKYMMHTEFVSNKCLIFNV